MISNIFLIFFWLILIPYVLGKVISKDESNMFSWVMGNIVQMAIFFIISLWFILNGKSFSSLLNIYRIVMRVLLIITSIILYFKRDYFFTESEVKADDEKNVVHRKRRKRKKEKKYNIYKILAIFLILVQLFVKVKYTNINNDDASFVALSKIMITTDKMYIDSDGELIIRRALAPISAYYSVLAKCVQIDVTVFTHSIMPIFLIVMSYIIYFSFSKKIFKDDEYAPYIVLIFLSFLNLYAFSTKGISKYLILYPWFGRSILGGIVLPLIWKLSLDVMSKKGKFIEWVCLFITCIASNLGTEMATPLISISLIGLAITFCITDKKLSYIPKTMVCLIPFVIVGIIYLKMV